MHSDLSPQHLPIMVNQVIANLITDRSGFYIDATFGDGGHTRALLDSTTRDAAVLALDRDRAAIDRGRRLLAKDKRLALQHSSFADLAELQLKRRANGILMDLGISSRQLDDGGRGFSFTHDGPLDMRMDVTRGEPLSDWLARAPQEELARVLRDYGEEPQAARIAAAIVEHRRKHRLATTAQLASIILKCIPRRGKTHPATRSFQALRIFINQELQQLQRALAAVPQLLAAGGRLAVITFHSLEARIVKQLPDSMKHIYKCKPSRAEVLANRRSRSAVLRVLEKAA